MLTSFVSSSSLFSGPGVDAAVAPALVVFFRCRVRDRRVVAGGTTGAETNFDAPSSLIEGFTPAGPTAGRTGATCLTFDAIHPRHEEIDVLSFF